MKIYRAYKFRLYPNEEQQILINKTIGSARYVYNYFLNRKDNYYKETKENLSLKNNSNTTWVDNGSNVPDPETYTWTTTSVISSNLIFSSDNKTVMGAIRMKMPHNGETPTDWNRYFTYTYNAPAGYTLVQSRINDTIADDGSNVTNKVFKYYYTNVRGDALGGAIYNTKDKSNVNIISDFISCGVYDYDGRYSEAGSAIYKGRNARL